MVIFLDFFQKRKSNAKLCLLHIKGKTALIGRFFTIVPTTGFEPARLAAPPPQDGESTNFST